MPPVEPFAEAAQHFYGQMRSLSSLSTELKERSHDLVPMEKSPEWADAMNKIITTMDEVRAQFAKVELAYQCLQHANFP